jgi:hypothetical protein
MLRGKQTYYQERASTERACAASAEDEQSAEIHHELAVLYERLAQLQEKRPRLSVGVAPRFGH